MTFLKEPLLHFLLLGGALFVVSHFTEDKSLSASERRIVVSPGRIEQLVAVFSKTWQRPPTSEELKGLIDDFVLEELYYREARAMGLDQDDTIIRRRLRQKLEFLTNDLASLQPSEDDLAAYLEAHPDKFRIDSNHTLRQVFINPERHGDDPEAFARAAAERLRAGDAFDGDPTLLPETMKTASSTSIDNTFGSGFSERLQELDTGRWSNPIPSAFGLHLVYLEERTPGRVPQLHEVRSTVEREWAHDKRETLRKAFDEQLLDRYEVVIEWPEAEAKSEGEK